MEQNLRLHRGLEQLHGPQTPACPLVALWTTVIFLRGPIQKANLCQGIRQPGGGSGAESVFAQAPGCCTKPSNSPIVLGSEGCGPPPSYSHVSAILSPAPTLSLAHLCSAFLSHLSITYVFIAVVHAVIPNHKAPRDASLGCSSWIFTGSSL